ncbi:PREDICTED: probable prolyl 4-hydroxylase 9 isoform X2 [Lupinus angustifolius]|uniref:probable prolyl 4-hydroxylase 9 isoform X2 n=1 Tax=Lupinus angustifolius TaxID=3871 RepID=UPI00092EC115|nr:PREDICTED: probable prolyl 4-hydroxylase 9 isoform X2 [Lupinus angustifolius]
MKGKMVKGNWSFRMNKFTFPYVFLLCIFFFLAGFFGSTLFSQSQDGGHGLRPRPRFLESTEYNLMTAGDSGDDSITSIPFQVLSWKPRALYFPNFATAEQCEGIVDVAKAGLKPSSLALRKGENEENTKGVRTSSGVFVSASEDKTGILAVIEEKIARATMIPRAHGEMASFLLYLTDVEEGGETMFPFENGLNMDGSYEYEDCIGLKIRPRRGDGLLFYSLFPNGSTIDPTSLHGSCPVIKGEKWVATKWIRNEEQDG